LWSKQKVTGKVREVKEASVSSIRVVVMLSKKAYDGARSLSQRPVFSVTEGA
jgi:predicted transcriptional regulator